MHEEPLDTIPIVEEETLSSTPVNQKASAAAIDPSEEPLAELLVQMNQMARAPHIPVVPLTPQLKENLLVVENLSGQKQGQLPIFVLNRYTSGGRASMRRHPDVCAKFGQRVER